MKKSAQRTTVVLLALSLVLTLFAPGVMASNELPVVQVVRDGGVTITTQTLEKETLEDGLTTLTKTVDTSKEGITDDGAVLTGEAHSVAVTSSNSDGYVLKESFKDSGVEKKVWTRLIDHNTSGIPSVTLQLSSDEQAQSSVTFESSVTTKPEELGENYDYTDTVTTYDRTVTATITDEETVTAQISTDMHSITPENYEGKSNWAVTGVYHTDGRSWDRYCDGTTSSGYEDYVYKYTGAADIADEPFRVDVQTVIFEKDPETGLAKKDEEGNYIIKELKSIKPGTNSVTNYENGYPTQVKTFVLTSYTEDGQVASRQFTYCLDSDTPTVASAWYKIENLEDCDYFPDEISIDKLRAIIFNGYWGTKDGIGSVKYIRENMLKDIDPTESITITDNEGEEHTYNKGDIIADLCEGEALAATQAAIWSYANGAMDVLDGRDGTIVNATFSYATQKHADFPEIKPDRKATMVLIYNWLMSLAPREDYIESPILAQEKAVESISLTVGDKLETNSQGKDSYNASLDLKLSIMPNEGDELYLGLTYTDSEGVEQSLVKRLTAGCVDYSFEGLKVCEDEQIEISLNLYGAKLLKRGAYIYKAFGGNGEAQTMVGLGAGIQNINIEKALGLNFNVEETETIEELRTWNEEIYMEREEPEDPTVEFEDPEVPLSPGGNDPEEPEEPEEPNPKTADTLNYLIFAAASVVCLGFAIVKKRGLNK